MAHQNSYLIRLHTIGHGNRSLSEFTHLLKENGIDLVVDVRSSPYSRYNPQYNKENLEFSLKEVNIQYIFKGKQLGGRPTDPSCYKSRTIPSEETDYLHEVDYREVMKRDWFRKGIDHLLELAQEVSVAIMCSEEDPAHCHRHHLIAKFIMESFPEDVEVFHIREDNVVFNANQIQKSVSEEKGQQRPLF
jgi:uncharacterized protein (DUF488 family)